ncbi:MAG: DMT family transporter [Candidatus Heimdallarchaeota archaeon]
METKKHYFNPTISKISMLLSGIFMGNVGLFITFLSSFSIFTIVLLRGLFGTIYLTIFMLISKSLSRKFLKESFKTHWKYLILLSVTNPLVILLYFFNISVTGYAIAAFLLYTSGIFLLLLLIITKEEKISKINIISFILATIGVAIIMEFWNASFFSIGIILGILSGINLAILVYSKKKIYNYRMKNQQEIKLKGNFDIFLSWFSTLLLLLIFLPFGIADLIKLTFIDIFISMLLGLIPTALAFTLYNVGVKNDKGGNIVILSYFEPVMATINTAIFLRNLSFFTIIGGTLILIANILILRFSK